MKKVNVHEAKTQLSRLLEEVEGGERVIIARAGEPVAVLSPYKVAVKRRRLGLFAGEATLHDEGYTLVSHDSIVAQYGVPTIAA